MPNPSQSAPLALSVPVDEQDHILGPATAPLTLVEYGDYQCPHCGRLHPVVRELLQKHGTTLRYVFRHFPLIKVHANALIAASAAETAAAIGGNGAFWAMHEQLFTHQQQLAREHLTGYAQQVGLDVAHFDRELDSHVHEQHVRDNLAGGMRSGVNGTPALFFNGRRQTGGYDRDTLNAAVAAALPSET